MQIFIQLLLLLLHPQTAPWSLRARERQTKFDYHDQNASIFVYVRKFVKQVVARHLSTTDANNYSAAHR